MSGHHVADWRHRTRTISTYWFWYILISHLTSKSDILAFLHLMLHPQIAILGLFLPQDRTIFFFFLVHFHFHHYHYNYNSCIFVSGGKGLARKCARCSVLSEYKTRFLKTFFVCVLISIPVRSRRPAGSWRHRTTKLYLLYRFWHTSCRLAEGCRHRTTRTILTVSISTYVRSSRCEFMLKSEDNKSSLTVSVSILTHVRSSRCEFMLKSEDNKSSLTVSVSILTHVRAAVVWRYRATDTSSLSRQ